MNTKIFLLGTCAVLAIGNGTAQAGPCSEQIDNLTKILASKDAGAGPTPGAGSASTETGRGGQHPPTSVLSQETKGVATSPEDVRRQNAGQSTGGQPSTGTTGTATTGAANTSEASQALSRARDFDRQGKEADCMSAVVEAKRLSGS